MSVASTGTRNSFAAAIARIPSRCRDRGCAAAGSCARENPAPAGSRAWCRDGRSERGRGLDLDADAMRRHAVAVVRAVHDEAPAVTGRRPTDFPRPSCAARPSARSSRARACRRRPCDEGAQALLVRTLAEMHVDLPAAVRLLEGRAGGVARIEAFRKQIGEAAGGGFACDQARDVGRAAVGFLRIFADFSWTWSQRFMPGGGPNFHRNYRQDIHRLPHSLWRPGRLVFRKISPKRSTAAYTSGD